MASSRKQALSQYNHRYKLANGERSKNGLYWLCVYCGDPATCRDHVPPITRVSDYESLCLEREFYFKVNSCISCNTIASDSVQESIFGRIEYVKDQLKFKNKSKLNSYEWSEEELLELGRNLRSKVATETRKSKKVRDRVEYYGGFDALTDELEILAN